MKKTFLLLGLILLFGCSSQEVVDKDKLRPDFDFQKTYILRQNPFAFTTYYNVWKYLPIAIIDFEKPKDIRAAKYFNVRQQISLIGNNFLVRDLEKDKKYLLKEELLNNSDDLINYSISENGITICNIKQITKKDILNFDLIINEKTYKITGEIKKKGENALAFTFSVNDENVLLCKIIKEYLYFDNAYEIVVNREFSPIKDLMYICVGVFLDQILKENGYQYK